MQCDTPTAVAPETRTGAGVTEAVEAVPGTPIATACPPAPTVPPFRRADLDGAKTELLNFGRWGRADVRLLPRQGECWVVKDFGPRTWLLRNTWGRFMVRREFRALQRLRGIEGIPADAFRLDAHALAYRFAPGRIISDAETRWLTPGYFQALERLVGQIHARGIVHLDMRYGRNILVTDDGQPMLLDFQSYVSLDWVPRCFHRWLQKIDLSGVYKHWYKKHPESLGAEARALLERHHRLRRLWFLKGLAGFKPERRRRPAAARPATAGH